MPKYDDGDVAAPPPGRAAAQDDPLPSARARAADVIRKFWASPTTALGLGYGITMHVLGKIAGKHPHIFLRDNAVQFTGGLNPGGAITLGNTTTWTGNPYDPNDPDWHRGGDPNLENGHTRQAHERQHTYQAEQLGLLYLPSNLLGGLWGLLHKSDNPTNDSLGERWHSQWNWNETGPQGSPPRAWPER